MKSFLSKLYGNTDSESSLFPREEFGVISATLSGKPIIGSINRGYKNYPGKTKYPWCLKLAIALNLSDVRGDGLPKSHEVSKPVYELENYLLAFIKEITVAHYIGHIFYEGFLDVYVYLKEPQEVARFLESKTENSPRQGIDGIGYEINNDPSWKTVEKFMK